MQVVARTLSRASRKRDYSPSVDFLTFGGVIRGQVSVQRLKAVGMAYNDASSVSTLPSRERNRSRGGGVHRGCQPYGHVNSRMETAFAGYGMNPDAEAATLPEPVFQGTGERNPVGHSVPGEYIPVAFQCLQAFAPVQCLVEQFPAVIRPIEGKAGKQYGQ